MNKKTSPNRLPVFLLGFVAAVFPVMAQTSDSMADGGNAPTGYDMAPETRLDVVNAAGLKVKLPVTPPCKYACVLKITGLKMNPPVWTASGNPQ